MKKLIYLLFIFSLSLFGQESDFEYKEGFATWGKNKLEWGDDYGDIDSIKIVAIDTTSLQWGIIIVEKHKPEYNRQVIYVPDGIYYMRAYLFFPNDVKIESDISLQQYRQLKLDQPAHGEYGISATPLLTWKQLFDTQKYQIQVAKDSLFADLLIDTIVEDTVYKVENTDLMTDLVRFWAYEQIFNGTHEATTESDEHLFRLQKFTIATWVYPTASGEQYTSVIFAKAQDAHGWQSYTLSLEPQNTIRYRLRSGTTGYYANSLEPIPLNQWSYLVGTFDATSQKLYVNGELVNTNNHSNAPTYTEHPIIFGAEYPNPEYRRFIGRVKSSGIWNRALTESEIKVLYEGGKDIEYPLSLNVLELNTRYYWRVRPVGEAGPGQWSGKQ